MITMAYAPILRNTCSRQEGKDGGGTFKRDIALRPPHSCAPYMYIHPIPVRTDGVHPPIKVPYGGHPTPLGGVRYSSTSHWHDTNHTMFGTEGEGVEGGGWDVWPYCEGHSPSVSYMRAFTTHTSC